MQIDKSLLTQEDVAQILGVRPNTLAQWRFQGKGPKWCKLEGSVRYKAMDLDAWIESGRVHPKPKGGER